MKGILTAVAGGALVGVGLFGLFVLGNVASIFAVFAGFALFIFGGRVR